ncbi:MAG: S26 family signal peptidase, partial [Clostridia bacterium]
TYTYTSFMALKETAEFGQLFSKIENDFFITIPEDSIFYLGDNRAKSEDCSKYGPVKVEHIIGKVELIIKESKNIFGECLILECLD